MAIETLPVGPLQVNCYLLICDTTRAAAVIDPGDEGRRILDAVAAAGCDLKMVINTHGHFDHIGANAYVIEKTGVDLLMHADDVPLLRQAADHAAIYGLPVVPSPEPSRILKEGDLFVGEGLFAGSVGRTDLPGGSHEQLINGIRNKLMVLPAETVVYPGHGPATTIGREKLHNPFL